MVFRILRGIGLILGLTVLGATLGLVTPLASALLFQPPDAWRILPTPPRPAAQVVAGDYHVVYIEDADGQVYRCVMESTDDCWQPWSGTITPDVDVRVPNRWVCPTSLHDEPPGAEAVDYYFEECVPGMMMASDAAAFRLLPDGRVEAWTSGGDGTPWFIAALSVQCLLPLGAVAGLVVGIILVVRRNQIKGPEPARAP